MNSSETINKIKTKLQEIIKGRNDTIDLVLTALFANGHVLLEDYPGSGKTTLAKSLGNLIDSSEHSHKDVELSPFRRIQFTPDLLPTDVLGLNIFEPKNNTFRFQAGPIFSHVILADEMNRTGPKVQAAFLECMAERQVTIDNKTYPLDELFFVIGTQNPLDLAGTYPLPMVQLDRFLLKVPMSYVSADVELEILKEESKIKEHVNNISAVVKRSEILSVRKEIERVNIKDQILECIVDIVQNTRINPLFHYGASTRSAIMFKQALSSYALIQGRDFVTEDDLKYLAPFVLLHRLKLNCGMKESKKIFEDFVSEHIEKLIKKVI